MGETEPADVDTSTWSDTAVDTTNVDEPVPPPEPPIKPTEPEPVKDEADTWWNNWDNIQKNKVSPRPK